MQHIFNQRFKSRARLLCGVSTAIIVALGTSERGYAQQTPDVAEVTVTATRVVRDGYNAPTPTSVVGDAEIEAKAPANIADLVEQLPSLSGSVMPTNAVAAVSAGLSGINALNLRDLGVNRTLVLLDGQRVAPSTLTGWVDVNTLPEALVSRVDVVTGGASADWGSDAVAGVVNFVLNKNFTGIKGEVSGGMTTYGDNGTYKISVTGGTGFANNRGHILFSAEDNHSDGITGAPRSWANNAKLFGVNPAFTAGVKGAPEYLTTFTGVATATPGGIITSGPAKGTYFGPGGTPLQFNYGTVSGNFMQGGQSAYTYHPLVQGGDLVPEMSRENVFFRSSYDVTDDVQIYGQASYSGSSSRENALLFPQFSAYTINPVTNAFLPASVAAAAGATPFTLGTFNTDVGPIVATTGRQSTRGIIGANGGFNAAGSDWTWDAHAQTTINDIKVESYEINKSNLTNAINAVKNPSTGAVQCASVATNPACVPYDVFGTGVNSAAAINYLTDWAWGKTHLTENDVAANLQGSPISNWAGLISVAAGIEYRSESVSGSNDPISTNNGWVAGNEHATHGSYNVTEGYLETVVPLAKDVAFAKSLEFNGAVRETGYSTSGTVTTWKAGLTWSPIDDITFRSTRSHDIRAPNLSELFAAGITSTSSGLIDPATGTPTGTVITVTGGNTSLKPEVSNSIGLGAVLKPNFFPGFETSVDYYQAHITDAIFAASNQQILNQCAEGDSAACAAVTRNAGVVTQINVVPLNLARQTNRGLDFEASYRRHLAPAPFLDGDLSARVLATYYLENSIDSGIAGVPVTNNVGTNSDGVSGSSSLTLPRWRLQADVGWEQGPVTLGFTMRGVSAGVYNTSYIQCTANCPVATAANPTIDNNHIPGAFYFDANAGYTLSDGVRAFLVVQNLADTPPVARAFGTSLGGPPVPTSPTLYDVLGRTFRVGIRFKI